MIEEYLKTWDEAPAPKPSNDPEFVTAFIEYMKDKSADDYEFTGDNGYCGHTAILYDVHPRYSFSRAMAFEFAYGVDFVKVFTAYHDGFWVPEYISLKGGEAAPIIGILNEKFVRWGGFAL
jgi:hypothetical protein